MESLTREQFDELAHDWAMYRKYAGVRSSDISVCYKAFRAGWIAAKLIQPERKYHK